jgi:AraC-like DNA-binding protein
LTFLNTIPLIGALFAFLLWMLILSNKVQNKAAKITLSTIVLMSAHNLFESYLYYNGLTWPGLGLSYLHYHLIGPLFLLYTYFLFKIEINLKLWAFVLIAYTLLRLAVLEPIDDDILDNTTRITPELVGLLVDNILALLLNILLLLLAYLKIRKVRFAVNLTSQEQLNFNWLKSLLIIAIILYFAMLISAIVSVFDDNEGMVYLKIESVLTSIFSLSIAFMSMRFPIFSVFGDFQNLPEETKKKYAKSSLKTATLEQIWEDLNRVMKEDRPYRNPEYRLNDLSASVGESVHHVSQVINEKQGISFSDFVNQFRIKDALDLLNSPRAKQITILAISLEAGFNSKTAFYKTFKKVTGKTPSDYMR